MKLRQCPECKSEWLGDQWAPARRLRQHCNYCGWRGVPRVPEQQEIQTSRAVPLSGFFYEIFDGYGRLSASSRTYSSEEETEKDMLADLARHRQDPSYGVCTGVLWPAQAVMHAKVYKGESSVAS